MLFVVASPIGNLQDFSIRGKSILESVDIIIAEDTRSTKKLCTLLQIETRAIWKSFHAQSSEKDLQEILHILQSGKKAALLSDAGTPAISDPGTLLVNHARKLGIQVSPIPGACALVSAICASGFPSDHFEFLGFLPHKKGRQTLMKQIYSADHTIIFYESTHRILKCIDQMHEFFPEKQICVARELTKIYEEFIFGTPAQVKEIFMQFPEKTKGEFVVLVANQKHSQKNIESPVSLL